MVMVSGPPYSLGFKLTPMIDSAAPKVVRFVSEHNMKSTNFTRGGSKILY